MLMADHADGGEGVDTRAVGTESPTATVPPSRCPTTSADGSCVDSSGSALLSTQKTPTARGPVSRAA
jgi:hypothetical protein